MNKYQEALEFFTKLTNRVPLKFANDEFCEKYDKNLVLIKELVDKDTPMKPVRKRVCHFKSYSDEYICPNCGYHFVTLNKIYDEVCKKTIINNHKCCNNCGQSFDWSGEDENTH